MQPYNYNVQQIDPFGSALKGVQTGMAFNQMKAQQVAQKQQMANQARIQSELADLSNDFSYDSLLKFSLRNPEYVKQFEKLYEPMSLREKEESFKDASRMYALSLSNPEAAIVELDNRSKMFSEAGDEEQARLFKGLADGARQNPGSLSTSIGMFLYGADSDKFAEMQDKLSGAKLKGAQAKEAEATAQKTMTEALEMKLTGYDLKKKELKLLKDELNLEKQKIEFMKESKGVQIPKEDREFAMDAIQKTSAYVPGMIEMGDLIKAMPVSYDGGYFNVIENKFKKAWGSKDDIQKQDFIKQLEAFTVSRALAMRPEGAGAMSDAEFESYKSTVPNVKDNSEVIAKYILRSQRLLKRSYARNKIISKYISKVGSLLKDAPIDIEISKDLPKINAGENAIEYMERLGADIEKLAPKYDAIMRKTATKKTDEKKSIKSVLEAKYSN